MNPYTPKRIRERQRPIDDQVRLDLEWQSWNWNVRNNWSQASSFIKQVGDSQENGTSHKNEKGKDSKDGKNGTNKYSLSESSVIL